MQMKCMQVMRSALAALVFGLLFSAPALYAATPPQLWPTFSKPSTIINVGLSGQSGDDFMATTSFAGAYNQQQLGSRIYVDAGADANYWLTHGIPSGLTVTNLSYNSSDPDGVLKALLSSYGPNGTVAKVVTKYIICDPLNVPESCNMATTEAGINDAMVVNPDNLTVVQSYGLTLVDDLRNYVWIGTTSDLVNNNSAYGTINMVSNPSGGNGTTGWSGSGTLSTTTFNGQQAIEWQLPANQSGDHWITYKPAISSSRVNTTPYIFSFQVAGSGTVFMDVWNGCSDVQSSTLNLTSTYKIIQMAVQTVVSGCTNNNTIQIQLRAHNQSNAITAYFNNAAVVDNRVAVDYYQYKHLLANTTHLVMSQHNAGNNNLRDYEVAANMFVFDLTSDGAYSEEVGLYQCLLTEASSCSPPNYPATHVTPIMGYIDHEIEDTQFMSDATKGNGHFLNASDNYNNGSVWASMPQPASLSQPAPGGIKTSPGTVYVAFAMSDGDNASFVQHQDVFRRTGNNFYGAVPMAWTTVPGMMYFGPTIYTDYFNYLAQSQEMMGGPSGVGYTRQINGSNISTFAGYTADFMTASSLSTVTNWANSQTDFNTYSTDLNEPHSLWGNCAGYGTLGSLPTVTDGQCVGYQNTAVQQIYNSSTTSPGIEQWLSTNYAGSGAPTFLEALNSNFNIPPDDTLWVAQQLQLNSGYNFVFLTPSELALTEQAYKNGTDGSLPTTNAEAVAGSTLTSAFPQNVLYNAQGQSGNYGLSSTSWALGSTGHGEYLFNTIYQGGGANELVVPANAGVTCYAFEYLGNGQLGGGTLATGRYYRFTVNVAGSGNAQMTIYDGSANNHSAVIPLTSSWQSITMIVKMNSATAGQIQVGVTSSSSRQTLYFNGGTAQPIAWYYNPPSSSGGLVNAGGTTYNNGSFNAQSMYFFVPSSQSSSQWISAHPGDTAALSAGTSYTATVDVAGTAGQQAYLDLWDGSTDSASSTVTLGQQWQTLKATYTGGSSPSGDQFEIRVPSGNSADMTVYFRNASLVPTSSIPSYLFQTGLESGDTQLHWTNTVDTTAPGGGESNVTSALTESSSTITRGGGFAIQYGGTASGGSSTHAYLEAFNPSVSLSSASRLSYWIYPITPLGSESGASSTTGLNSTCVALDIIFTDGTDLRDSGVKDQYGNQLHPAHECNHLQPDTWNYVTADLSSLSGKTVARIDVGYDQAGASGNYAGFIDDIGLTQ